MITGGAGFLGSLLATRLLAEGLALGGEERREVEELLLVDLAAPRGPLADETRVRSFTGDMAENLHRLPDADAIFHLAGVVSGAAEADFDLGMRTNLDGTRQVLEWARARGNAPVLVFTSSLAVFGTDADGAPLGEIHDRSLPTPASSYGIQKFIGEQLVADYGRRGFVRARTVRLMTVSVRPGVPNGAASSFLSSIIREPVSGQTALCPVPSDTPVALSSPQRTIDGIVRAAETPDAKWGSRTAMNLPSLTTTPRAMAEALDRVTGHDASRLIEWSHDPQIEAIVGSWPSLFRAERAAGLGLHPVDSIEDIVREFVRDHAPVPDSDTGSGSGSADQEAARAR
ncbi:D-erythronate dehydrogenase [Mycetocola zhujimingii]|uniref:D-erythronate dehydrogenase n=1 Tax=Mycetocola zhujimingii TaxID=2079792 RepID=UPI0018E0756E|nr:D-erythronate dehydrogenase [Mycetocola zhujimingii]